MNTWIQGSSTTDEVKKFVCKKTQIRNKEGGSIEGICFLKHLLIGINKSFNTEKVTIPLEQ